MIQAAKAAGITQNTQTEMALELAARLADVETNYNNLKKELDEIKKKVG